jgi:hypothetical protein
VAGIRKPLTQEGSPCCPRGSGSARPRKQEPPGHGVEPTARRCAGARRFPATDRLLGPVRPSRRSAAPDEVRVALSAPGWRAPGRPVPRHRRGPAQRAGPDHDRHPVLRGADRRPGAPARCLRRSADPARGALTYGRRPAACGRRWPGSRTGSVSTHEATGTQGVAFSMEAPPAPSLDRNAPGCLDAGGPSGPSLPGIRWVPCHQPSPRGGLRWTRVRAPDRRRRSAGPLS